MKGQSQDAVGTERVPTMGRPRFKTSFIKEFHTVWYASVMGTGISSCILYRFPYPAHWLRICGIIMFGIAVLLFIIHTISFILRNFVYYRNTSFITDVKQSVYLGCVPMAFSSLVNMVVFLVTDYDESETKNGWFVFIYVLFWIDVILSVGFAWGVTFFIFWKSPIHDFHQHGLNATLLLPMVTMTVTASTGGLMINLIPSHIQVFHLILCFMLWANTVALAMPFIAIYFGKLYITKFPPKAMIFTSFIPIGVLGQGSFGLTLIGYGSKLYLNQNSNLIESADTIAISIQVFTVFVGLFLLSFGYFMTFIACGATIGAGLHKKFTRNFWAMTFPLGTMAVGNGKLGELYSWEFFKAVGAAYGVATVGVTICCLIGSLAKEFPHDWYLAKFFSQETDDNSTFDKPSCSNTEDSGESLGTLGA